MPLTILANAQHGWLLPTPRAPSNLSAAIQRLPRRLQRWAAAHIDASTLQLLLANASAVQQPMGILHFSGLDFAKKVDSEYATGWRRYALDQLRAGDTLVDVGGNLGIVPVVARWLAPCLTVVTVEPVPETFLFLEWNLHEMSTRPHPNATSSSCAHAPSLTAVNRGMSLTSGGNATFKVGTRSMNARRAGQFAQDDESDAVGGRRDPVAARRGTAHKSLRQYVVPTTNLEDLLADANVTSVDLLKLDCEGCE